MKVKLLYDFICILKKKKLTLNADIYNFICIQKSLKKIQSTPNPIIIEKELKIENDVDFLGVRLDVR